MPLLRHLLDNNRRWAEGIKDTDPGFFKKLSQQQAPEYLWIGCSDSRVPANQITGLMPGEVFVHRNVANVIIHTDLNCLSVLQYAVEVLKVKHIIVCGHYGCGGVKAALETKELGLIDNWLRTIKDIYQRNRTKFKDLKDDNAKVDLLCELNVLEQMANICHTPIVQNAWKRGQSLSIHAWIYSIQNGLLKDLNVEVTGIDQIPAIYRLETRP